MSTQVAKKNQGGRPSLYSVTKVAKLIEAFHNGFNIEEACQYAEIDKTTYYRWLEKKAGFATKMADAQAAVNKRAKVVVAQAINEGDASSAKWWLERRDPSFKAKGELEVSPAIAATRDKIKEFLDEPDESRSDDGGAEPSQPAELSAAIEEVAESTQHIPE